MTPPLESILSFACATGASCTPDMAALTLFFRLIIRPALREPARSLLVIAAVAVFDQTLQKTVVVKAGHSYLARAS